MVNPLRNNQGVDFICIRWNCCYLEFFIYQYLTLVAVFNRVVRRRFKAFVFIDMSLKNDWCLYVSKTIILGRILALCNTNDQEAASWCTQPREGKERGRGPNGAPLGMDIIMLGNTIHSFLNFKSDFMLDFSLCFYVKGTPTLFQCTFDYYIFIADLHLIWLGYLVPWPINPLMQPSLLICVRQSLIFIH